MSFTCLWVCSEILVANLCVRGERFLKKRMVVFGVTLGKELLRTSGRSGFLSPVIPEVLETTRDSPASQERSV